MRPPAASASTSNRPFTIVPLRAGGTVARPGTARTSSDVAHAQLSNDPFERGERACEALGVEGGARRRVGLRLGERAAERVEERVQLAAQRGEERLLGIGGAADERVADRADLEAQARKLV